MAELNSIADPCSLAYSKPTGLDDMGLVTDIGVGEAGSDGGVDIELAMRVTAPGCMYVPYFERAVRAALEALPEVNEVRIDWDPTSEWHPSDIKRPKQAATSSQ